MLNVLQYFSPQPSLCVYRYVLSGSRIPLYPHCRKRWRTHKTLSSLTQRFICYYTFKVNVGRKKQSMNTKSSALSEQRKTCHEKRERERQTDREKESRHRPWIFFLTFCCSYNILVSWFLLHSCASGVGPLFGAHPKTGGVIIVFLNIFMSGVQLLYFLVTSSWQLTFKPEFLLTSTWCRREDHIRLQWFYSYADFMIWHLRFVFLVIHPWLADLQRVLWPDPWAFSAYFSPRPLSPSSEISLSFSL